MTGKRRKPRVLGISEDQVFTKFNRVEMPLFSLKKQGLIEDYHITDNSFGDVPLDFQFDVIWLLRNADNVVIDAVTRAVGGKFIYDLDDLYLVVPSYRTMPLGAREPVIKALERCELLCTTSMRLCRLLEKHSALALSHKALVCLHGFEFSRQIRKPKKPSGILWTSSDFVALTESRDDVLNAVASFAGKRDLPVYFFGLLSEDIMHRIPRLISVGFVPYWQHKVVLASLPPMIGVAPLETEGDGDTLDFVNGKSDIKMVELGGLGHPSVYSAAPPYTESDLEAGVLVANTYEAWFDGLERIFDQSWKNLDSEQEQIVNLRHIDKIAAEVWHDAISRVRLPEPMCVSDIRP